jgi:adenine C2-methylase RlmN of 23S rRNA A2503 and tRNA A37
LPELRTDLFGKNVNRKFYTVSLQKPERSTLCLSTVNGGCLSYCIDVRIRSRMHDM